MFRLLKAHGIPTGTGDWNPKGPTSELDEVLFFLHFAKMIRERRKAAATRAKKTKAKRLQTKVPKPVVATYRRRFGAELPFVEEREWRIVYHPANKHLDRKSVV